jgi:hypothetical protein
MAKSYLRKSGVAARYATTPRNVERMVDDRRIPPPDFYNGRFPLWDSEKLDEHDRRAAVAHAARKAKAEHGAGA